MTRLFKFLKIAVLLALISASLERAVKLTNKLRINLVNKA